MLALRETFQTSALNEITEGKNVHESPGFRGAFNSGGTALLALFNKYFAFVSKMSPEECVAG